MNIENPILPGFNADPSAIYCGGAYYVVTSTFNWMPAVSIYRSDNLADWKLVGHALEREDQIDLRGNPASCGVWAPQISYNPDTGLYYLLYSDVKNLSDSFFDLNNYIVSARSPEGPWSARTYLNSSGFDPSLFHDDDQRSYVLNLSWEFRQGYSHPGPIIIQEFDMRNLELIGGSRIIIRGNPALGCTEGPHMIKRGEWYYLILAEGGTGYGHAVSVYRSKSLGSEFEADPRGPMLSSRSHPNPSEPDPDPDFLKDRFYNPAAEMQKAGHGSLVEGADGQWFLFHLSARPLMPEMRCTLNRETSLQRVVWEDDWPRLEVEPSTPRHLPRQSVSLPEVQGDNEACAPGRTDFRPPRWPLHWYSMHDPVDESWCRLGSDGLSLTGRNSPYSRFDSSLVARRIQHFSFDFETELSGDIRSYRQMAGLILLTGNDTFYYLRKYYDERYSGYRLGIMRSLNGSPDELKQTVAIENHRPIVLRAEIRQQQLRFLWGYTPDSMQSLPGVLDASVLSDEFTNKGPGAFDGSFCGLCAQDLDRREFVARFRYADYQIR